MADDITLTVRVRDMTRGDFNQIRQRMRGMGGDIRRIARASDGASASSDRFANSLTGLQRRLSQFQRTGNLARHEMDYMRRSMGLLGRDLRGAAADGELTEDQFRALRRELERTRLDFDHLDNQLRRQDAMAQRRARNAADRQREAERLRREAARAAAQAQRDAERRAREERRRQESDARAVVALRRRMSQAHAAALRQEAQRNAAAARDELRRQQAHGRQIVQQQQRLSRAHAAALVEEAQRNRRAQAERERAAARMGALLRQQAAAQRQQAGQLAGLSNDNGLNMRFRSMGDGDARRMARALSALGDAMDGVNASSGGARRNVRALSRDLQAMSQILQNAQRDGNLSRREYSALANGLTQAAQGSRQLRRSGDMTRSSFRNVRREVALLRAQLRLLGNEGNAFQRLDSRLLIFQRRLRDTRNDGNVLRRSMNRMGDGLAGGLRTGILATGLLIGAMRKLGSAINVNKRWTLILVAALLLIGPAAQAIGALLIAVLGAAFIALGTLALKNSALVKRAFQEMKSSVASSVREAAQPMEEHLVAGIQQVGIAVSRMQPLLTAAFAATGPLIQDFVGAFTDLAGMSMPGIVTALREMGPAMEGFRTAMGLVGQGFGDMFAAMTEGGGAEALRDVWITLGVELANLLVGIGEFINKASQSGTATTLLISVFRTLSGVLNLVQAGLGVTDALFGGLLDHINEGVTGFDSLGDSAGKFDTGFVAAGQSVKSLKEQLKDTNKEIAEIKKNQDFAEKLGPSGEDFYLNKYDSTDRDLASAQAKRKSLTDAIAQAEGNAADATSKHAASVTDLIAKISTLNDINRSNLDARAGQEKAIDDAAELAKNTGKYSEALKMVKGQLDLNGEAGREAYEVLSRIAQTTKESTDAAIKANTPWEQVRGQWKRGYDEVVKLADGMGLSKEQARALADQIVGIPNKEIFLQARTEQAKADLDSVIAAMQAAPSEKTVTVKTLTADSITALENLGFVVEQLPDGSFTVTAETGTARDNIGKVQGARDALKGKKITMSAADASSGVINAIKELVATLQGKTITITTIRKTVLQTFVDPQSTSSSLADALRRQADNARGGATGGLAEQLSGFADGGSISGDVLEGPGTKKSDSLMARLSRGEFVMRASAVDKYGPGFMKMINEGRLPLPGFAKGGAVRREARQAISPIKAATSGTTEKNLLRLMSQIIKGSIKMATALKSVTSALDKAKTKLSSLRTEASSLSSGVKSRTMTDVTAGVDPGKAVTTRAIMGRMTVGRDKATAFASALKRLKSRGLSSGLLRQIAEAGIEGGGLETAGALLRASGSEIKSLNSLHSQMSSAAGSAGKTTADAVYGKQIKIQEKLVKSLDELAKELKKATAKSKKKATGGIIGAASGGLRGGLVEVGEHGPELVRLPFGSSVYSNPDSRRIAGGRGGSSGQPTVIQVFIGEKKVDEVVLDSNRRTVRTRGGNVQAIFSQR